MTLSCNASDAIARQLTAFEGAHDQFLAASERQGRRDVMEWGNMWLHVMEPGFTCVPTLSCLCIAAPKLPVLKI